MHVQYVMLNVWAFLITKQVREQKQMTDERVENQTRGTRLRFFPSEQRKRPRGRASAVLATIHLREGRRGCADGELDVDS